MAVYVLDTDTLSLYQREFEPVCRRVDALPPTERAVAIITVEEQLRGRMAVLHNLRTVAQTLHAYQLLQTTVEKLKPLKILPFTEAAIVRYNELKAMKLNVGLMDLRIAAIALEHGATVVTRNVRDFARVPDLTVENWAD